MNRYRGIGGPSKAKLERKKKERIERMLQRIKKKQRTVYDLPFTSYPEKT